MPGGRFAPVPKPKPLSASAKADRSKTAGRKAGIAARMARQAQSSALDARIKGLQAQAKPAASNIKGGPFPGGVNAITNALRSSKKR